MGPKSSQHGAGKATQCYVQMPYSDKKRWDEIVFNLHSLTLKLEDPQTGVSFLIEETIKSYSPKFWRLQNLHEYFRRNKEESRDLIKNIITLALRLPDLIPRSLPILQRGTVNYLNLTQHQCACILANAFFCTFPETNSKQTNVHLSCINFNRLVVFLYCTIFERRVTQ